MANGLFRKCLVGIAGLVLSTSVYAATVTHIYELDGTRGDSLGGPDIVLSNPEGLGPTGYTFQQGGGPNLRNVVEPDDYSIEMVFRIDASNFSSFRKLLDFKDRTSLNGLYKTSSDGLDFERSPDVLGPVGTFTADTDIHLVVTRDSATAEFVAYIDGAMQFMFLDTAGDTVLSGPNQIVHLLIDDSGVSGSPSGFVDQVRIYQGALTAAEVADLAEGGLPPGTTVRCGEQVATIVGTRDDDLLVGSAGPDVIAGLRGNDTLYGFGGDDILCGGPGDDILSGGEGNDTLLGDTGKDVLNGEADNDTLRGGAENDSLDGGPGNDRLFGNAGNDTLDGHRGGDRLNGGADRDICDGGDGATDIASASTCEERVRVP